MCDSGAAETATPPVNVTAPSISGTPAAGQTLTCSPGTFTQSPGFGFQWLSDGAAIAGATATTFTGAAPAGHRGPVPGLRENVAGHDVATSAAVVPPRPAGRLPRLRRPRTPSVRRSAGRCGPGRQLTCSPGTFTGATAFAFAWLRNGTPFAGATVASYTLTATDAGRALQCRVTATGPGGSTVAESTPAVAANACIVPALIGQTLATAEAADERELCCREDEEEEVEEEAGPRARLLTGEGHEPPRGTKVALTISKR